MFSVLTLLVRYSWCQIILKLDPSWLEAKLPPQPSASRSVWWSADILSPVFLMSHFRRIITSLPLTWGFQNANFQCHRQKVTPRLMGIPSLHPNKKTFRRSGGCFLYSHWPNKSCCNNLLIFWRNSLPQKLFVSTSTTLPSDTPVFYMLITKLTHPHICNEKSVTVFSCAFWAFYFSLLECVCIRVSVCVCMWADAHTCLSVCVWLCCASVVSTPALHSTHQAAHRVLSISLARLASNAYLAAPHTPPLCVTHQYCLHDGP